MDNKELEGLAAQGLGMARIDYEKGCLELVLAVYFDEHLERMRRVEESINAKLGRGWLNNGDAKDAAFGILREMCALMPPKAIVLVTASNRFEPTAKFQALPDEQKQKLVRRGNDYNHQMVKDGLMTIHDSFTSVAQTPQTICVYTQDVDQDRQPAAKPVVHFFQQEHFSGRLKMF